MLSLTRVPPADQCAACRSQAARSSSPPSTAAEPRPPAIARAASACWTTDASTDSKRISRRSGAEATSSAAGVNGEPARSAAIDAASSSEPTAISTVRDAGGAGASLNVAVRTTPRQPNDPVRRRARS